MREIKFRAWVKKQKNDEIIEVYMIDVASIDFKSGWVQEEDRRKGWDLYNCELMQYTGLKDKSGKEIYEGDIVQVFAGDPFTRTDEVVWNEYHGCFALQQAISGHLFGGNQIEVIGNIYENPSLRGGE